MVITSLLAEQTDVLYSLTDDYDQLLAQLQRQVNDEGCMWILCDLDSLPQERLHTLQLMKEFYQHENKSLIMLLSKHNMPLFLHCIRFCPPRIGCLKMKILRALCRFFSVCWIKSVRDVALAHRWSAIRKKIYDRSRDPTISGSEWWLMEELFKGKSLSQISDEVNVDIRRLSYIKRHLMKRLNIRSNIALFSAFRGIMP